MPPVPRQINGLKSWPNYPPREIVHVDGKSTTRVKNHPYFWGYPWTCGPPTISVPDSEVLCYAVPQMWGVSRWTARFLLLVMLVPAFGPLTMACVAQPEAMHCMRHPESASMSGLSAQPEMPCHHAMAQSKPPRAESSPVESSEASLQAGNDDNCCQNHCCCGATTSEWAQPASNLLSFLSLLIEPAQASRDSAAQSTDIFGHDSARAPPRS